MESVANVKIAKITVTAGQDTRFGITQSELPAEQICKFQNLQQKPL